MDMIQMTRSNTHLTVLAAVTALKAPRAFVELLFGRLFFTTRSTVDGAQTGHFQRSCRVQIGSHAHFTCSLRVA